MTLLFVVHILVCQPRVDPSGASLCAWDLDFLSPATADLAACEAEAKARVGQLRSPTSATDAYWIKDARCESLPVAQ